MHRTAQPYNLSVTFDFTFRSGATTITFEVDDFTQSHIELGDGEPLRALVTVDAVWWTGRQYICFFAYDLKCLAEFLRSVHDSFIGSFTFSSLEPGLELEIGFVPPRLMNLRCVMETEYFGTSSAHDPEVRMEFRADCQSPHYREALDRIDDILCVLYS